MVCDVKSVTRQHQASKNTFFLIHLIFQSYLGLKISDLKKEKCHTRGRGQKIAKKVSHIIWMAPNSE
jgi:hypothetical protein